MEKTCVCGHSMELVLQSMIYQKKVNIEYVPTFRCERCERSEVMDRVKPLLSQIIHRLGSKPEKQLVIFKEHSEIASILYEISISQQEAAVAQSKIEERVNQLLDLLILANQLGDPLWIKDVHERLNELSQNQFSI